MRVQKKNKAFAYRVPIGDNNYLQCATLHSLVSHLRQFIQIQEYERKKKKQVFFQSTAISVHLGVLFCPV